MGISGPTKRKLLSSSGGFCAKPDCHKDLFPLFDNGEVTNIEELAHIVGKKTKGPRGLSFKGTIERDNYENLIVLCPTCHTIIDKNPSLYTENIIKEWKKNHEERISALFSLTKCVTRGEAREEVCPLFLENRSIFDYCGPYSEEANRNLFAAEQMWERLSFQKILPNNRKIEQIVTLNSHLLLDNEKAVFYEFKMHREGFEYNKLSGDKNASVPRFPPEFEKIFQ